MTAIAATPPRFINRSRLQLAATLLAGIAIGSVAGVALTDDGPAGSGAKTAAAGDKATTSASEQYSGWYTRSGTHQVTTSAGEQYRFWYSGEE